MAVSKEEFIREYSRAIREGTAAVFAGAGFSRPNGFVDWKGLLRQPAKDIGLDIDKETDLLAVAQYCRNKKGTRSDINTKLIEAFSKTIDTGANENAEILTKLPIKTYWTTNYDHVIEENLKAAGRIPDVKADIDQLQIVLPNRDAVVYKMHGDVSNPSRAVLTKEDYELYDVNRPKFRELLVSDLISKVFLFIGFSFTDPNIDFLLGEIKKAFKSDAKTHYSFSRRVNKSDYRNLADYQYACRKQDLQEANLNLYGIQTVFVNEFGEITDILRKVEKDTRRNRVFISGSANEYSGDWERNRADELIGKLTKALIRADYNITSGFGLGIGSTVITSALEEIYNSKSGNIDKYLCLRPFPQNIMDPSIKVKQRTQYRENMIHNTGVSIFLFGNKIDVLTGKIMNSPGCKEEYIISKNNGNLIIPVGTTGYAAKEISDLVKSDLPSFPYLNGFITTLDTSKDIDEIVNAVLQIMNLH